MTSKNWKLEDYTQVKSYQRPKSNHEIKPIKAIKVFKLAENNVINLAIILGCIDRRNDDAHVLKKLPEPERSGSEIGEFSIW